MMDTLEIPAFLRGSRPGPKPAKTRRWTRLRAQRPEGAKWEAAERWEVTVPDSKQAGVAVGIPPGTRHVWAIYSDASKWTELRDAEEYAKVPARLWAAMMRNGRRVS